MEKIKTAVILLAGYGTRCLPFTKVLPKAMLPILNKPAIHYVVEEVEKSGFERVIFVLPKCNGRVIKAYFSKNKNYEKFLKKRNNIKQLEKLQQIKTSLKTKFIFAKPNGSGGAVLKSEKFVKNQSFAVLNGDDLFFGDTTPLNEIVNKFKETQTNIIGVKEVKRTEIEKYGIIEKNKNNLITKIFEKPKSNQTNSNLASFGRYIFTPEIFDILKQVTPQPNGEIFLTDAISVLVEKSNVYCQKINSEHFDGGNEKEILLCSLKFGLQKGYSKEILELVNSTK